MVSYFSLMLPVAQGSLSQHKKSVHQGVKYPCTICAHKASSQGNLSKHIKAQHEHRDKYRCESCNKEEHLRGHIKSAHEGIRYNCNICQYRATMKGDLTRHKESIHFKKRFPCQLCNYSLNSP